MFLWSVNSFAPFSPVGESATLVEYKDGRLLMQGNAWAVTDPKLYRPPPRSAPQPRAPTGRPTHTYRENGHFHEPTGTRNAQENTKSYHEYATDVVRNLK